MTTPVVPKNSDMKSPSWLMEKLSVFPSWWKPEPTIRMRMETETAEVVEKAIPLWAEPSCFPLAMAPPRKRLYPTEVVLTRLMMMSAGSAETSVLAGKFGMNPQASLHYYN